jgi:hypothetical protein
VLDERHALLPREPADHAHDELVSPLGQAQLPPEGLQKRRWKREVGKKEGMVRRKWDREERDQEERAQE